MRTTARFEIERKKQLKFLFSRTRLIQLWRELVKDQMRRFDITDLHDYYDFNYAIETRTGTIVERVLAGQYRAEVPLIYRVEKKLGVCRHMMIPSPSDALVFQLLTDVLYGAVMKAQPSKSAYYARDRHSLSLPHELEEASSYPWFFLWPKFQQTIWNFSKAKKYLVTTDVTNYFDNIGLRELRHVISAIARTKEVYLDLLFSLIEDLSWTPDYLPRSRKGLPTIHIEAPRLLAHALLFEVDYLLKNRTKNSFVRWMDDINFGVNDKSEAKVILGEINDVLKSRGLALNLAKTDVMTAKDAEYHFLFKENVRLSKFQASARKIKSAKQKEDMALRLEDELAHHLKTSNARNRDKLTKRFLTILGILGIEVALPQAKTIYFTRPSLRGNVLRYLSQLPFTSRVARTFRDLLAETPIYDDVARFTFVNAVVNWTVPLTSVGRRFVSGIHTELQKGVTSFDWLCIMLFLAKYGEPHEVLNTANRWRDFDAKEPFFARQRIAAITRSLGINAGAVFAQWERETSTGATDSSSVAYSLLGFARESFPGRRQRLYFYLFPDTRQQPYPLPKFLLLCALAHSERASGKVLNRPIVAEHVTDPWYRHWLALIHPSWF